MFIYGSENILFHAINTVDDQNGEQEILMGPVTQRVTHLGNRVQRSFNHISMSHENVMAAVANVGDFVHDTCNVVQLSDTRNRANLFPRNLGLPSMDLSTVSSGIT